MTNEFNLASLDERPPLPAAFIADLDAPLPTGLFLPEPNAEERAAARRLSPNGARRFLLRRQIGRTLLAHYSSLDATAMTIAQDEHGAPFCLPASTGLHISFAHRGALSTIAIARLSVGIDLERTDDQASIPWRVLHPREAMKLRALSEADQPQAFLRLWTMKEACVKALGRGFALAPDAFCIEDFGLDACETVDHGSKRVHVVHIGNNPHCQGLTLAVAVMMSVRPQR